MPGQKMGPMIYAMLEGTYAETHEYRKIKAPTLAFFATNYRSASPASAKCQGFDRKIIVEWVESQPEPQRKDAQEVLQAQQNITSRRSNISAERFQTAGTSCSPTPITFVLLTEKLTFFVRCGSF